MYRYIYPLIAGLFTVVITQAQEIGNTDAGAPGFHAAPTVKAFADGNISRVVTIAVSDFDKQNGSDLVTVQANGTLNGIYNDGRGGLSNTYQNNSANALNPNVVYIEAADLNRDGFSDVVAADSANSVFLVFLNKGDGSFADAQGVPVGSDSGAKLQGGGLAVVDANGDGFVDVVTFARSVSEGATTFSQQTFLGVGDGTFRPMPAVDSSLSGQVSMFPGKNISVADRNGDGTPDLVLQLDQAGVVLGVSLGVGDGTFRSLSLTDPIIRSGPQPASSLTLDDVTGDGISDAVFVDFSNKVYVARGDANGEFAPPVAIASNLSGAVLLRLADVNNDGSSDIVVHAAGEIGVFTNKGDGTFQLASQYTGGYGLFQQPQLTDFNGDGNLDMAALDYTNGRIAIYAGNGDGTFYGATPIHRTDSEGSKWAANMQVIMGSDLNGDGAHDILAYEWVHSTVHGPADLFAGINDGTGKFSYRLALPSGKLQELGGRYDGFAIESASADFNGDRRSDVIYRTGSGLSIALANEDGTLNPDPIDVTFPVPVACMPFQYVTTGDVNGDGAVDIVTGFVPNRNCTPSASTPSGYFVLLGDGTGHFSAKFTPYGDGIYFVRLADWNGDGKLDLAVGNGTGGRGIALHVLPGNGDGSFEVTAARTVIESGQFVSNIVAADYNGDGKLDLIVPTAGMVKPDGSADSATAGILLLAGSGDLAFADGGKVLQGITSIWNGAAVADMNADGTQDLVISTYAKAQALSDNFGVIVLPGKGNGEFDTPVSELAPLSVTGRNSVVFVTDFNRDAAPDILTANGHASQLFFNVTANR